nr:MAG TPA: hypothetical protein [Caudoviricetes sp.]
MDHKEPMLSDSQKTVKINASHAQIVVGGAEEKPVYSILYFDTDKKGWYIGWGSSNLKYVQTWLKEEFEPGYKRISDFITDLLARAEEAEARAEKGEEIASDLCDDFTDFVTGGVPNAAPYCANYRPECVDGRGWCDGDNRVCKGFLPKAAGQKEE